MGRQHAGCPRVRGQLRRAPGPRAPALWRRPAAAPPRAQRCPRPAWRFSVWSWESGELGWLMAFSVSVCLRHFVCPGGRPQFCWTCCVLWQCAGGPLPTLLCPACRFAQPPPARHDLCQRGRGRAGRTGAPGGLGDENARGLRRRHPFWWEADQAAPRGLRHVGRAKRTWREEPRGAPPKRGAAPRRPALHVPSGAFLVIPVISQISFWYLTRWRQPGISITNNSPAF